MESRSDLYFGYIGIILAIIGWGLSNSLIVYGLGFINPYLFLTVRFILTTVIFSPFIFIFKREKFLQLIFNKWTWIIAFFEFAGLEFQYLGQQSVSAGLSTLLMIQFIIFVPILSTKFLHTTITKGNVIAISIALMGSVLIATDGKFGSLFSTIDIGIVFLLLSALSYAFYIISSSYFTISYDKQVDSTVLFFIVMIGLSLFSTIPTIAFTNSYTINNSIWGIVIMLVVFSTIIPFIGYFKGLKVISANTMSLVLLFQLVVPFFIDIVFLGISYSFWIIIGSVLITSSLMLFVSKPIIEKYQLANRIRANVIQATSN